ncbi:Spondin-2 [Pseudolycoriella hygida]|uniref:Spondin-2 n=1 Tax=Pseudolycoriella hygida TaxID=35572 RepID=A0A9Q0NAI7_9DIPT|nr:Spondin-2 [Pseudolycoriella hygida]
MKYTSTAILVLNNCFTIYLYAMIIEGVYAINISESSKFDQYSAENGCSQSSNVLIAYKFVLQTYWTRDVFPKHYPNWKPQAQWSKTFGLTHDASFNLFSIGKVASNGMKMFAETGQTNDLEYKSMDEFDFTAPAILTGRGYNDATFFADVNHSLVSFATKITPSPDWFVGVDSFKLCENDIWIDNATVALHPLDAGTDNGFTFTAPDWPTEPTGVIYRITSGYPAHQAGSFFYPQLKELPPIATVTFIKLKEYRLLKTYHDAEEEFPLITTAPLKLNQELSIVPNNELLSAEIEEERRTKETFNNEFIPSEKERIRSKLLAKIKLSINSSTDPETAKTNDFSKNVIKNKNRNSVKKKNTQQKRDCRVGDWSEWSPCDKTCGIGKMQRYRKIIRHSKNGGRSCPPLKEAKWCELERDCISEYF